ncbi:Mrx16 protein [Martiniozyma asiatica (nom. inval.)]|nr:Mrx16 protein [Martiniozyma asiatica]
MSSELASMCSLTPGSVIALNEIPQTFDFMHEQQSKLNMPQNSQTTVKKINFQIPVVLPHERMYTLNIGNEKFILSGASLSFDSPSYFTDFFLSNSNETILSIDRSPKVFQKIYLHLQGYSIEIENEYEFIYLLMDSSYFKLTKLRERLMREGFIISISNQTFRFPKEIMTQKGNYPNLFSIFYNRIIDDPLIPKQTTLIPPPLSPTIINRDPKIFSQLLSALHGNQIEITSDSHREDLLKDCTYYQFFALEQRLIPHKISKNPFTGREEITIKLEHLKKKGLLNDSIGEMIEHEQPFTVIKYSRPYVDDGIWRDLIVQINSSDVTLLINPSIKFTTLILKGKIAIKMKSILASVTDDYIYEEELIWGVSVSKLTLLIRMDKANGFINGNNMDNQWISSLINAALEKGNDKNQVIEIKLTKSQWTINVQGRNKIWMDCVKFDGLTDVYYFNQSRKFL